MRQLILMCVFCAVAINAIAQNEDESVKDTINTEVLPETQIPNIVEKSTEEQLQDALRTIEEQKKLLLELRGIETGLTIAESDKARMEKKANEAERHAESVEKSLISMASNFLYIPYEAYGVEEIAIKAFDAIESTKLKQEYRQRYLLLKNYQTHLREFKAFLERVQKACNGAFQATATEFIDTRDPSVSTELILKKQPFYLEYLKYSEYKDTYIGGLIQKTESILEAHTKQKRANLQGVIKEIDKIQTPKELDSVEKVIETIDERLKTVEDL